MGSKRKKLSTKKSFNAVCFSVTKKKKVRYAVAEADISTNTSLSDISFEHDAALEIELLHCNYIKLFTENIGIRTDLNKHVYRKFKKVPIWMNKKLCETVCWNDRFSKSTV